jgi:hypothetical protein
VKRNALHESRPQDFDNRFFGGPSSRVTHCGVLVFSGKLNLRRSEAALQKRVTMSLQHPSDALNLYDVRANALDHFGTRSSNDFLVCDGT